MRSRRPPTCVEARVHAPHDRGCQSGLNVRPLSGPDIALVQPTQRLPTEAIDLPASAVRAMSVTSAGSCGLDQAWYVYQDSCRLQCTCYASRRCISRPWLRSCTPNSPLDILHRVPPRYATLFKSKLPGYVLEPACWSRSLATAAFALRALKLRSDYCADAMKDFLS